MTQANFETREHINSSIYNGYSTENNLYNIIFFSLLDSDWLKSVPINP